MLLELARIRIDGDTQPPVCYVCEFNFSPILHRHHIRPKSEGGANTQDNFVYLCPNCHSLVHQLYQYGAIRATDNYERSSSRFYTLTQWVRVNMGDVPLGKMIDLHQARQRKKDTRYE